MWRWRVVYVQGERGSDAIQRADALLARLAEADAIVHDAYSGAPLPVTVVLNPSGISATVTYYGHELSE